MDKVTKNRLYKKAIDEWGYESQLDMVVEECAELIQAIQKLHRAKGDTEKEKINKLAEELADVEIMLEQTKFMYSWHMLKEKVEEQKENKLLRLKEMLEE